MGEPGYPEASLGGHIRLAKLTPRVLLDHIIEACTQSATVISYTVLILDLDILNLRVHLVDNSFIEVFYNEVTDKTSFALIDADQRIYGKDNAKMGWHMHPLNNPKAHHRCKQVSFETFLAEVEMLRFSSFE